MKRPHVTCLMEISVDGRIIIDRWPDPDLAETAFESLHDRTKADAWLCGRVTMRYFAGAERRSPLRGRSGAGLAVGTVHLADPRAKRFAVAVDGSGRLLWKKNEVQGDHVITLLTSHVAAEHFEFLRRRGVSYVVAGRREIDFAVALAALRAHFGIKRLTVEGGGTVNASLLHAGLIDELSLLVFPVADGRSDTKSLFETPWPAAGMKSRALTLLAVARQPGGVLHLRYRVGA